MKIVISSGHGKYVRGASGYIDEVDEARKVVPAVATALRSMGHTVTEYHDDVSHSQNENLNRIVDFHNSKTRDLDVSVHFNAYETTSKPMGTECLYVTQSSLAADVAGAISSSGGLINRGAKKRTDLFFLNNTEEPAVLIETCFVDSSADCGLYQEGFNDICNAIAGALVGEAPPADRPPARPEDPYEVPLSSRPVIGLGDTGQDVEDLQWMLPRFDGEVDGDFGPVTESAVRDYQYSRGLDADGIVGQQTWGALYAHKPPIPPPPHAIGMVGQEAIMRIANESEIASYAWEDRGQAPRGYTQGMALAFAQSYKKLKIGHPAVAEMSKARTNSDKDALNIYRSEYDRYHMSNERDGADTLRHLYALMLGSGMRESSGRHCEGRDQSASNVSSDTAEAGLFQTSYNAHSASDPEFDNLMNEYSQSVNKATCYLDAFDDDVSCSSSEWSCYGSGRGYDFQKLCKECPAFAVETHALTLRNLANHYGPIIRKEVELMPEANEMFLRVQNYVDEMDKVA
jgi:hypothetical protein